MRREGKTQEMLEAVVRTRARRTVVYSGHHSGNQRLMRSLAVMLKGEEGLVVEWAQKRITRANGREVYFTVRGGPAIRVLRGRGPYEEFDDV